MNIKERSKNSKLSKLFEQRKNRAPAFQNSIESMDAELARRKNECKENGDDTLAAIFERYENAVKDTLAQIKHLKSENQSIISSLNASPPKKMMTSATEQPIHLKAAQKKMLLNKGYRSVNSSGVVRLGRNSLKKSGHRYKV